MALVALACAAVLMLLGRFGHYPAEAEAIHLTLWAGFALTVCTGLLLGLASLLLSVLGRRRE